MKRNILLFFSIISSMLFLWESNYLNISIAFIFVFMTFLYLKGSEYNIKDFKKRDILNVILILLMLISKGNYTYGTVIRYFSKSQRLFVSILFCLPNLYWVLLFSKKINKTIFEVLDKKINKLLAKLSIGYTTLLLILLFIIGMFPKITLFYGFFYITYFYASIPLMLYATQRFINLKKDYMFKSLVLMAYSIIITTHINATIQGSYIIIYQAPLTLVFVVLAFLIFPMGELIVDNNKVNILNKWLLVFLYSWSIFILVAIVIGFFGIKTKLFPGIEMKLGDGFRLWINTHPEASGITQSLFFMLSLSLFFLQKRKTNRILVFICILINYICLALCNTRGPFYLSILFGAVAFYIGLNKKHKFIITIVSTLLFILITLNGRKILFDQYTYLQKIKNNNNSAVSELIDQQIVDNLDEDTNDNIQLSSDSSESIDTSIYKPRDITNGGRFLNGRDSIWNTSIQYFKDHPKMLAIGVTQVSIYDLVINAYSGWNLNDMHSEYFQILTAHGVFTLFFYLCFNLLIAIKGIFIIFSRKYSLYLKFSICVIGSVLANFLVYESLTNTIKFESIIFFLLCGIVNAGFEINNKQKDKIS